MGIWKRLGLLLKSNINEAISKAEDPEKILNQLIIDMQQQLVEAKKQVAVSIADEKRLHKQYQGEARKAQEWERKAMMAVQAGKDDLAMQALGRKTEYDKLAGEFEQQWMGQKQAADQLRGALHQLNNKIEEAKRKKNLLIARQKRAEAQKKIQTTLGGLSDNSAFDTFDRMADRVEQAEAEASAQAELAGDLSGDNLSGQFDQLESAGAGESESLLELKRKMGMLPPAASEYELPESTDSAYPKVHVTVDYDPTKK